jgi:hypothetical protein
MSKVLANNVYKMRNEELIGLAKNRFLPANVQLAIAKFGYRRAHEYLTYNLGLDKKVRDYLWSDECNKGYVLKTSLLAYGHYKDDPSKYWDLYTRYPSAWGRSPWRMSQALFGGYFYGLPTRPAAPSDLLNKIYDDNFDDRGPKLHGEVMHYWGPTKYQLSRLAQNPNVDLVLAIKLSQRPEENIKRLGFAKIVELSK